MRNVCQNEERRILEKLLPEFISHSCEAKIECSKQRDLTSLAAVLRSELYLNLTVQDLSNHFQHGTLIDFIINKLARDHKGNSILYFFAEIERIAKIELHRSISLRWSSDWSDFYSTGNWLTHPDWVDFVEMFERIEVETGVTLGVSNESLEDFIGKPVGDAVKYLWLEHMRSDSDRNLG